MQTQRGDFPDGPQCWDCALPLPRAQVPSLVRKPRLHKAHGRARNKGKNDTDREGMSPCDDAGVGGDGIVMMEAETKVMYLVGQKQL